MCGGMASCVKVSQSKAENSTPNSHLLSNYDSSQARSKRVSITISESVIRDSKAAIQAMWLRHSALPRSAVARFRHALNPHVPVPSSYVLLAA